MAFVYWLHLAEHTDPKTQGYIGITSGTVEDRFASHVRKAKRGGHLHVHRAIRKYGDTITVTALHEDDVELCELIEWAYRSDYNTGWNHNVGGCPSGVGVRRSEDTRKKMSSARRGEKHHQFGKPLPEETRRKMSESHKGKVVSESSRKKLSASLRGRKFSEAHRHSISTAAKGKMPWENPTANKEVWALAEFIYDSYLKGLSDSALANAFRLKHNKIAAMQRKFKSGWNPLEDEAWLSFKAEYEKEKNEQPQTA